VPAQTQWTPVQRLSPKNKGVSPYIPLQAGYRSKSQSSIYIWLHVTSVAVSFHQCCVTFMFQFFKFYLSAWPSPPPVWLSEHSLSVSFLASPLSTIGVLSANGQELTGDSRVLKNVLFLDLAWWITRYLFGHCFLNHTYACWSFICTLSKGI
jgi:hypothetical protein